MQHQSMKQQQQEQNELHAMKSVEVFQAFANRFGTFTTERCLKWKAAHCAKALKRNIRSQFIKAAHRVRRIELASNRSVTRGEHTAVRRTIRIHSIHQPHIKIGIVNKSTCTVVAAHCCLCNWLDGKLLLAACPSVCLSLAQPHTHAHRPRSFVRG